MIGFCGWVLLVSGFCVLVRTLGGFCFLGFEAVLASAPLIGCLSLLRAFGGTGLRLLGKSGLSGFGPRGVVALMPSAERDDVPFLVVMRD